MKYAYGSFIILTVALMFVVIGVTACPSSQPASIMAGEDYEYHLTAKDSRGHWNVKIEFPDQPAEIIQGQDYTKKVTVELNDKCWLYKVDTFNGLDRGDIVEMDTFVYDDTGRVLYQRSLHKESPAMYNSFWPIESDAVTSAVDIHMHAHVTKSDEPARAHWNVMLWCAPVKDEPTNGDSGNYYTLIRAGVLPEDYTQDCTGATSMVLELCVQRQNLWHQGYTGPIYALENCRSNLSTIGLDDAELDKYVSDAEQLLIETDRFITRLPMEIEDYQGRSVVNKEYYEPFQVRLKAHLAESEQHNAATQTDPCREQHAYDGLKGWCGRCYVQ